MSDIKDYPRKFEVWLDKDVVGVDAAREVVAVPAGVDADEFCAEVLNEMIANELYTGWNECDEEE